MYSSKYVRAAKHAGSWYSLQQGILSKEMDEFLVDAQKQHDISPSRIKAIIGPHAGFKYSGPVAAWAYKYLQKHDETKKARVFILGPSHHKYFQGCSLSGLQQFQTPFGNLQVDCKCIQELKMNFVNTQMSKKQEEKQHSIEMHLPFIKKIFKNQVKIVPIVVGVLDENAAKQYAQRLSKYFDDQNTLFIISSDFCHWGSHFAYQPFKQGTLIHDYIEQLDRKGLQLIEKNDTSGFDKYIEETENTICGEFPIRILMHLIKISELKIKTQFVKYDQSDKVKSFNGSSVSYATSISYLV